MGVGGGDLQSHCYLLLLLGLSAPHICKETTANQAKLWVSVGKKAICLFFSQGWSHWEGCGGRE